MNDQWRERLRQAVKNRAAITWTKESVIAREAGIAPETLSRVLNKRHARPSFETVVRIALAAKESVAYLIGEHALSTYDDAQLLLALHDLRDAADRAIQLLEDRVADDALPSRSNVDAQCSSTEGRLNHVHARGGLSQRTTAGRRSERLPATTPTLPAVGRSG